MKIVKKIAVIFLTLFFINNALADDSIEAHDFIDNIGKTIIKIAKDKNLTSLDKRTKIIDLVDNSINPEWISRFVLGINYRTATEDQRREFTSLYRQFMINTYGPKFKDYDGEKFEVLEVIEKKNIHLVKAEFLPKNSNISISVDFRIKKDNGKFLVLDFITEGISLIETQRSEFNSAISQQGMESFLKSLKSRVEKLEKENQEE